MKKFSKKVIHNFIHSLWITFEIHRCGRGCSTAISTAVETVCDAVGNPAALTRRAGPLSLGTCLRPFRACVPAIAPPWAR